MIPPLSEDIIKVDRYSVKPGGEFSQEQLSCIAIAQIAALRICAQISRSVNMPK
jgi:hypothetical protein